MILTIVFPPEVGEGATASHNFIVCTNWMQIKRWWNHEKIEKKRMFPPSVDSRDEYSNFYVTRE